MEVSYYITERKIKRGEGSMTRDKFYEPYRVIRDDVEKMEVRPEYYRIHLNNGREIERKELIEALMDRADLEPYEGRLYGNLIKYVVRCLLKGGMSDLKKIITYSKEWIDKWADK